MRKDRQTTERTVRCDAPGCSRGFTRHGIGTDALSQQAYRAGWRAAVDTHGGRFDFCPDHVELAPLALLMLAVARDVVERRVLPGATA